MRRKRLRETAFSEKRGGKVNARPIGKTAQQQKYLAGLRVGGRGEERERGAGLLIKKDVGAT